MNDCPDICDEVTALASAQIDAGLTDDQIGRLDEVLGAEPAARLLYVQLIDLHVELTYRNLSAQPAGGHQAHLLAAGDLGLSTALENLFTYAEDSRKQPPDYPIYRGRRREPDGDAPSGPAGFRRWFRPIPAAAMILIAATVALVNWPSPSPSASPPARLARSAGADLVSSAGPVHVGDTLPLGRLELRAGVAQLVFANGAQTIISSPAAFEHRGGDRVVLHHGQLSAVAPAPAVGFTVETPTAVIQDLGTRFGVTVDRATGQTDVQVLEGRVRVEPKATPTGGAAPGQELIRGQAQRIAAGQQAVAITYHEAGFVTLADMDALNRASESSPSITTQRINLIARMSPLKHASGGSWEINPRGELDVTPLSDGTLWSTAVLPVQPMGAYRLHAEFTCRQHTFMGFFLPVGSAAVSLQLDGYSGLSHSGLELVHGRHLVSNETHRAGVLLQAGKRHAVDVHVQPSGDQARVQAWVDGRAVVDWTGAQAALSLRPDWRPALQRALGIAPGGPTVYHEITLEMLSGAAVPLED